MDETHAISGASLRKTVGAVSGMIGLCLFLLIYCVPAQSAELLAERRKDQFPTDSGYLFAPLPYSMPGIGEGFFLLGHFSNAFGSTADPTFVVITGDAEGLVGLIDEAPLFDKYLFLRAEVQNISTALVNNYEKRGMDTDKNDYNLLEVSSFQSRLLGLDLVFFDRQLNFSVTQFRSKGDLDTIRDHEGVIITDFSDPYRFKDKIVQWSAQIDMTDDYLDPRKGLRINYRYIDRPRVNRNEPDFFVSDLNASFYLPTWEHDTLVFNYFQSDANVRKKGNIDPNAIAQELGFECDAADSDCLDTEAALIDVFVNQRRHGTATSLGGDNRFRAYPQGRFNGAHIAFVGAEYRWNFVQDATPFDFFIWKDTHTGFQLAFFAEYATVSETWGDLWDDSRYVYGAGMRLVTASGSVYRADLGMGDEGAELSLFFFYPWN